MTVLVYHRKRYRFVRTGCPTQTNCPRTNPVTVMRLNRDGTDAYLYSTECVPLDECTEEV